MEAAIISDIRVLQATRMCQLAAAVIIIYDHVQTFNKEVSLIWNPGSVVSILYFLNRYVGDAIILISATLFIGTSFSTEVSHVMFQFQVWGPFVSVWTTQVIMQLRIFAMYRKSKKILLLTSVGFAAEIAAIATVLVMHFDQSLTYTNEPIPGFRMCSTSTIGKAFTAIYIPIFCFEFLLFALALFVVFESMAKTKEIRGSRRLHRTMDMIVKSSTVYFFIETSGCAVATGIYLGLPSVYIEIANAFLVATTVVLGSRLVINTRDFYSCPQDMEYNSLDAWPLIHLSSGGVPTEVSVFRDSGEV
ncbi:hypothetical protein BJ138DRAFT_463673 [Hygrophoropsis aurantiaca]|uniref:Uncharacterized protein n=1 Tax=Hygrophoropsis aurantiaca TaxID=72124 RepID=A0ACB8ATN1_9AGAM|nr:hypothetical protein BJ138DRAFT_463673 [Hygrophoropsis aurantiaca]